MTLHDTATFEELVARQTTEPVKKPVKAKKATPAKPVKTKAPAPRAQSLHSCYCDCTASRYDLMDRTY